MNVNHLTTNEINDWILVRKRINQYQKSNLLLATWQLANTLIPYILLWVLIYFSLELSYWLTGFLIVLASGFLVRLFIIFHDCGHGSFFESRRLNKATGKFLGLLAFTPYYKWHNQHLNHHATVGNLDKRGVGDVWTLTKDEYVHSPLLVRIKYRLYRNPLIMFGIGPLFVFLIQNRLTRKDSSIKERFNIYHTNAALLALFIIMSFVIGFYTFVIIQLLILYLAALWGIWLFYLQHQFEEVSWYRDKEWNYNTVALQGSSFVKFPKILQWFSGNIGFHHIHHLNARIPNYYLEKCFNENSLLNEINPVTFLKSLKTLKLKLWDENLNKMVSFRNWKSKNVTDK